MQMDSSQCLESAAVDWAEPAGVEGGASGASARGLGQGSFSRDFSENGRFRFVRFHSVQTGQTGAFRVR